MSGSEFSTRPSRIPSATDTEDQVEMAKLLRCVSAEITAVLRSASECDLVVEQNLSTGSSNLELPLTFVLPLRKKSSGKRIDSVERFDLAATTGVIAAGVPDATQRRRGILLIEDEAR